MLPYMAQGFASALEDAEEIGECLEFRYYKDVGVKGALKAYENLRLPRTAKMQNGADANRIYFHMRDGE